VTRGRKNIRRIRTLGAEGTERSGAHNAHNHPSGVAEPSHADEILTRSLKSALALVDVQVLDHFIVAGTRIMSFAERELV
jgi:DNA repair protein RadC